MLTLEPPHPVGWLAREFKKSEGPERGPGPPVIS
jgi:hypothetical protein